METNQILQGDCLEQLKTLPEKSVNMYMTSPPYFGLRDYNVEGQSPMSIKLFEMFSGYGGTRWALEMANTPYQSIGYSEIKPHAIKMYNQNFPNSKNWGDCTKINPSELPDFNLLCAGHPCQSFSMAGKRLGFKDMRGTLIFEVFRIIKAKKPKVVLLENVEGLLTIQNGDVFVIIMEELSKIGYYVDFKLFNSKEYGTPQNRSRVFYIGIRKDEINNFTSVKKTNNLNKQTILI